MSTLALSNRRTMHCPHAVPGCLTCENSAAARELRDLVGALLYYDRKEDEDLDRDDLEEMLRERWTNAEEIKRWFCAALDEQIAPLLPGEGEESKR